MHGFWKIGGGGDGVQNRRLLQWLTRKERLCHGEHGDHKEYGDQGEDAPVHGLLLWLLDVV
jgi:hypothetical protein